MTDSLGSGQCGGRGGNLTRGAHPGLSHLSAVAASSALWFRYLLSVIGLQLWNGIAHRRCYAPIPNTTLHTLLPDQLWPCSPSALGRQCPAGSVCLDHATLLSPLSAEACAPGQTMCPYTAVNPLFDNIGQSAVTNMQFLSHDAPDKILLNVQNGWADWSWPYFVVMTFAANIITNLFVGVFYTQYAKLQRARKAKAEVRCGPDVPVHSHTHSRTHASSRMLCHVFIYGSSCRRLPVHRRQSTSDCRRPPVWVGRNGVLLLFRAAQAAHHHRDRVGELQGTHHCTPEQGGPPTSPIPEAVAHQTYHHAPPTTAPCSSIDSVAA